MTLPWTPTPHPTYRLPTPEEAARMGPALLDLALQKREELIRLSEQDPLNHGIELKEWWRARELLREYDELLLMGGNRSSKSEFAAKWAVEVMLSRTKANFACFHSSEQSSINQQQRLIYKMLPPHLRDAGKVGKTTNVVFTQKNGFSDNTFILPNGSQCWFFNYLQNPKVFEGYEFDGAWNDELVPMEFVEIQRYRMVTRRGKILNTFTPVNGYSLTVKSYVAGARTMVSRPAPLLDPDRIHVKDCPRGHMPLVQKCSKEGCAVIYFFSEDNPFNPYDELVKKLDGATPPEIKIRAYGYAERMEQLTFPKFQQKVNVIPREKVPREGTRYMIIDPAGSKNWFILWVIVDFLDRAVVYREWPDRKRYGEWAVPTDKPQFGPGPAQRLEAGRGINAYKELILGLEGWERAPQHQTGEYPGYAVPANRGPGTGDRRPEKIHLRLIDPRMGGTPELAADEGTTLIDLLSECDRDPKTGEVKGPTMIVHPADSGKLVSEGVAMINSRLDYDEREKVTAINQPRLYFSEDCENTIYSMEEWIEGSGDRCAAKDPVDDVRYFCKSDCRYIEPPEEGVEEKNAGNYF